MLHASALNPNLVDEVRKQAARSTLDSFKTGAVLFKSKNQEIVGRGCSHITDMTSKPSLHAENHALITSKHCLYSDKYSLLVASIGKAGNFTYSSRPCLDCATRMFYEGVEYVYYPERLNNGVWVMNCETPSELINRAETTKVRAEYAKDMRIPA